MTTAKKQITDIVENAPDLGTRVQTLTEMQEAIDALTTQAVGDCRAVGITWNEIGKAFGMTRQTAMKSGALLPPHAPHSFKQKKSTPLRQTTGYFTRNFLVHEDFNTNAYT